MVFAAYSHNLAVVGTESTKSDFQVELLPKADPAVIQLCEQYEEVDPALALFGVRVSRDGLTTWNKEKQTGSAVLVPIVLQTGDV